MPISERIRLARKSAGLTQDELARKIDVKQQTIQKYEIGIINNIPPDKIEAMAAACNVSPAFLMGWSEQKKPAPKNEGELAEIDAIFSSLTPANREKLLELARLYLDNQNKNG